ncbi:Citrate synthase-like, core [Pseudocohnilembus persalinus]|uniref:Citrate synthase n=1 Tax=Pseudocohnilembus persalinus TaxID=266149 RepID=A0A0V0QRQ9_PSEPJ|nr:Citrate synthase-like, core [Pseudocohnilembus persalinus]|eukprot:KRX04979.1 Citrate synthase-like, core [Pseudocohnilembus persalinus]
MAQRLETIRNSLSIKDSRTGKEYEIPIQYQGREPFILASDVQKIKTPESKLVRVYDPGYMNTISATSRISFIDGNKGILEYRGYPIEQLAQKSTFLEVAFLLIYGELPSPQQYSKWKFKIMTHTYIHEDVLSVMKSFRYDAHPMGMLISTLMTVSTLHPEANPALAGQGVYKERKMRNKQIYRILGIAPTIAANCYRHRIGRNYNKPGKNLDYAENFLYMLDKLNEDDYKPHPQLVKALDILFILHAEHELNCSTSSVRHLASSGVDVYSCIAGSAAALYGPKHGGANEAVLRMLEKIGSVKNIPQFIEDVKNKKALLFGFGHRVYKSYDPRASIVKNLAGEVFKVTGKEPLVEIAMELEKIALSDEYFISRNLYPNVDFYSGVIYKSMGFPTDMFVVLFTLPRIVGWLSHWNEFLDDKENKIVRPRQNYQGNSNVDYIPIEDRIEHNVYLQCVQSANNKRRIASLNYPKHQ